MHWKIIRAQKDKETTMPVTNYRLKSGRTAQVLIAFFCASSICLSQPAARQSKLGAYDGTNPPNLVNWKLDLNGNYIDDGAPPDAYKDFTFTGQTGVVPVYGDWNGDGTTKIGVYVNGSWMIDYNGNGVWDGPEKDRAMYLGGPGYTLRRARRVTSLCLSKLTQAFCS